METKIIKVVFGGRRYTTTAKRTRTDYGQAYEFVDLALPDTFECIFSNSATSAGTGKKMIGSNQRCLIPDEYLKSGQTIYAWVLVHDGEDDGRHMYSIKTPVDDMPDTSHEEPTPVEQSVISQAITALNSAVTTTTQKAQEAAESADRADQAAEGAEGFAERAEAAQSASESARDRATQAETSARTSAATATEKASEAISSATTASQSAITAENASESAQDSADASAQSALRASQFAVDASVRAHNASEYAQTASEYASNASTSAQTASQKALEASQSASTAVQAKTDAQSAKQASETAQGLAESARNSAITAQESAEDARDEAQEIADGITVRGEQIVSNTERIESLEDDRYKPYPIDSASGAVASFPDGAEDIPLKSCIVQIEPVQAGEGDPSPDNVRHISGWTGCEVQRTGKNLLDTTEWEEDSYIGADGATGHENGQHYSINYSPIKTGVYDIAIPRASINSRVRVHGYDKNKQWVKQVWTDVLFPGTDVYHTQITINAGIEYIRISIRSAITDVQLELGSTATAYEPYQGQTYPITFPSSAGTIYGGYVDVLNGELVVTHAEVNMGTLEWYKSTSPQRFESAVAIDNCKPPSLNSDVADILIECYKTVSANTTSENSAIAMNTAGLLRVYDSGKYETMSRQEFKTAMSGVQLLYPLAEPIHYPITAIDIKTLLGQNNIWADCGDVSVEYRADITLYIGRLTEPDADMIADSNITSGSYFMVGNNLYLATANIASGASVIVGTNATKVSLATALNEINA